MYYKVILQTEFGTFVTEMEGSRFYVLQAFRLQTEVGTFDTGMEGSRFYAIQAYLLQTELGTFVTKMKGALTQWPCKGKA